MKPVTVALFLFLVATQAFSKLAVLLAFRLERETIAKTLCENKARPAMHCNGNCFLMKKLAEEERQSQPSPNWSKVFFQDVCFTAPGEAFALPQPLQSLSESFSRLKAWKVYSPPCSVFRPPLGSDAFL